MNITITTQEKERVQFAPIVAMDTSPAFPGANGVEASACFGALRFYELEGIGFKIWYRNYHISRSTHIHLSMYEPLLALHAAINNTLHCKLKGLSEITLLQGQFNFTCSPCIDVVTWFDANHVYTTFGINFTRDYLRKFAQLFPLLDALLEKAGDGVAGIMSNCHGHLTPEMNTLIKKILESPNERSAHMLRLEARVQELLLLALEQMNYLDEKATDIVLKSDDIEKIREVHDIILKNIENHLTLKQLARKVFINEFKLKKGFKKIYGYTVYDFLTEQRIEKAKKILLETDKSIDHIAFVTGYKSAPSFITAFKRKAGCSPGVFRRRGGM